MSKVIYETERGRYRVQEKSNSGSYQEYWEEVKSFRNLGDAKAYADKEAKEYNIDYRVIDTEEDN